MYPDVPPAMSADAAQATLASALRASVQGAAHTGSPTSAAMPTLDSGAVSPGPVPVLDSNELEGFEGPEKTIEMDFAGFAPGSRGLRDISNAELQTWLAAAKCTILSHYAGASFDSYVLSESSMFIYPGKVIMKTCGTTTLLRAVPEIMRSARECVGASLVWFGYTRKDFLFPQAQLAPHRSVGEEIQFLRKAFPSGEAHMLGPLTGDHWMVYVADYTDAPLATMAYCDSASSGVDGGWDGARALSAASSAATGVLASSPAPDSEELTVNIMMYDLHPEVAAHFFEQQTDSSAAPAAPAPAAAGGNAALSPSATGSRDWTPATRASGIAELLPGSHIQDWMFSPCGYSMNGVLFESYWTIHITPESHCSYASFETNLSQANYASLLKAVLGVFRPRRFTMTVFADAPALAKLQESPLYTELTPVWPTSHLASAPARGSCKYVCTSQCSTEFMGDYCAALANYVSTEQPDTAPSPAPAAMLPLRIGLGTPSVEEDERSSLSSGTGSSAARAASALRSPAGAKTTQLHARKTAAVQPRANRARLLSM